MELTRIIQNIFIDPMVSARKKAEKRGRHEQREKERKRRFGVNAIISPLKVCLTKIDRLWSMGVFPLNFVVCRRMATKLPSKLPNWFIYTKLKSFCGVHIQLRAEIGGWRPSFSYPPRAVVWMPNKRWECLDYLDATEPFDFSDGDVGGSGSDISCDGNLGDDSGDDENGAEDGEGPNVVDDDSDDDDDDDDDDPLVVAWPEICHRFMIWPWPAYANPQLSRTSRTSTCTHRQLSSCSWAVKKKKSGVSLPGSRPLSDFLESFFHLTLYEQPHFLSVWGDSVSDAHLAYAHAGTPTLSLSHTHTLPLPSQIRAVSTFPFSLVCLEKSQGIERLCRIQARTTALLNQQQAQLTDDRRIDMHGNPRDSDGSEKCFPRQTNFENISLSRKRGKLLG